MSELALARLIYAGVLLVLLGCLVWLLVLLRSHERADQRDRDPA